MAMNNVRFQALYNSQTLAAQRVFNAVPERGAQSSTAIHSGLVRTGQGRDLRHTQGCLDSLVRSGLVLESTRGYFVRVEVRGQKIKLIEDTEEPMAEVPKKKDPIDQLTALSQRLRTVADEVEAVALDFTEQLNSASAESKKLQALRALLKEVA